MAKQTNTRTAKLHSKYRSLQTGWQRGKKVPWLNVSGVWLEAAGFKVGDPVEITIENRVLTIKNKAAHGDR